MCYTNKLALPCLALISPLLLPHCWYVGCLPYGVACSEIGGLSSASRPGWFSHNPEIPTGICAQNSHHSFTGSGDELANTALGGGRLSPCVAVSHIYVELLGALAWVIHFSTVGFSFWGTCVFPGTVPLSVPTLPAVPPLAVGTTAVDLLYVALFFGKVHMGTSQPKLKFPTMTTKTYSYTEQKSQELDQSFPPLFHIKAQRKQDLYLAGGLQSVLILPLTTHYQTYRHTLSHRQTKESKTWPSGIVWQATICERTLTKIGLSHPEGHMPFRMKNCLLARQGLKISFEAWRIRGMLQCLRVLPKRTGIITIIALKDHITSELFIKIWKQLTSFWQIKDSNQLVCLSLAHAGSCSSISVFERNAHISLSCAC